MGSWNGTCAVTQLHVTSGQKVAVFMLQKREKQHDFCYTHTFYRPCILPFYGEYNDYGAVEHCYGIGLPVILECIKSQLTELEQGPNQYHDIAAKRDTFDIDALFELDHEDRLFIDGKMDAAWAKSWAEKCLKDGDDVGAAQSLEEFQQTVRLGKRITHVIVHGDVFDHIIDSWKQSDFVSDKNHKDGYYYKKYGFSDILTDLPAYLEKLHEVCKPSGNDSIDRLSRMMIREGIYDWNHPNLVGKWLRTDSMGMSLISPNELIMEWAQTGRSDQDLSALITDLLKGCYINAFMSITRKSWMKQTGTGGQHAELHPYDVLIDGMNKVIDRERKDEEDDDEI